MNRPVFQDPFAADDTSTQIGFPRPNPGGRGPLPPPPAPTASSADPEPPAAGLNPLVGAAQSLLLLIPQLRQTRHHADPAALHEALAAAVRGFSARAAAAGVAAQHVTAARYVLCTALDEAAADTPWGTGGVWAPHSLAATFHNDTKGGEKVFQLMANLATQPKDNLDLLELICCVMALGFEGRWKLVPNGRAQLDGLRDKLASIIRQQRGEPPRALAEHWHGAPAAGRAPQRLLPLAAFAAVAAMLLAGTYLALTLSLAGLAEPVHAQVLRLRLSSPVVASPVPAPKPRLAQFLQSDIKAGLVAVRDEVDRSVVTVRGDGTFAPASATLLPERQALMERVADALAQVPGRVLVTGHTDDQPLGRSARFPSNWHLSEARAKSVRELLLARGVAADRVAAEGRAAAEPVATGGSPADRAQNRRVEITLFVGRSTP